MKIWRLLENKFQKKNNHAAYVAVQHLTNADSTTFKSTSEYAGHLRHWNSRLAMTTQAMNETVLAHLFLKGLPDEMEPYWIQIVQTADNANRDITFEEITEAVLAHDERRSQEGSSKALKVGNFGKQGKTKSGSGGGGKKGNGENTKPKCSHCKGSHTKEKCYYLNSNLRPDWWKPKDEKLLPKDDEEKTRQVLRVYGLKTTVNLKKVLTARSVRKASRKSDVHLDSGAEIHIHSERQRFISYRVCSHPVSGIDDTIMMAKGKGSIIVTTDDDEEVELTDVYHVPDSQCNVISVAKLAEKGCAISFRGKFFDVRDKTGKTLFSGQKTGDSYLIPQSPLKHQKHIRNVRTKDVPASWRLWHARFGHAGMALVKSAAKVTTGMDAEQSDKLENTMPPEQQCEACVMGKQSHIFNHEPIRNKQAMLPGERWFMDIAGGGKITPTKGGAKYVLVLTDEYTDMMTTYLLPLREAGPIDDRIRDHIRKNNTKGHTIGYLRGDSAKEFIGSQVQTTLSQAGIQWEPTSPYSPHQNGVAERGNRTLFERVRAVLFHSGLSEDFWGEALNFVVYARERLPTATLGGKTPYEGWTGEKPDVSHMKPFGCICWAYNEDAYKQKLKFRGIRCRFLGFNDSSNQYRVWDEKAEGLRLSAYVVFDEMAPMKTHSSEMGSGEEIIPDIPDEIDDVLVNKQSANAEANIQNANTNEEVSPSPNTQNGFGEANVQNAGPNEAINPSPDEQNTEQTPNTELDEEIVVYTDDAPSSHDEQGAPGIQQTPPQTHQGPSVPSEHQPRRSTRPHPSVNYRDLQKGVRGGGFPSVRTSQMVENENTTPPKNWREALSGPDKEQWKAAFQTELDAMKSKGVWKVRKPPPGRKVLPGRWVLSIKLGVKGEIVRYKARWVAKGFEQVEGVDYDATFSSVVKTSSWKVLLALGTKRNMEMEHSDVDTAFLEATLKEEVWVEQPHGYTDGTDDACCLEKALYGLKQSSREWGEMLAAKLKSFGFRRLQKDNSIFINDEGTIVATYVDDLLMLSHTKKAMSKLKAQLDKEFKLKHLGAISFYLGMEISRNRDDRTMTITQKGYIAQMLKQLGMEDCHTVKSTMDKNMKLEQPPPEYVADEKLKNDFASIIGALNWVAGMSRPDISFAVHRLSRHLVQPINDHYTAAKRVMRYLAGTIEIGMVFGPSHTHDGTLQAYSDSSWHDNADNGRSTAGYLFKLANGPVSWRSKQEPVVAMSSTEAEYIAASEACKEAMYLKDLLWELGYDEGDIGTIKMDLDNKSAINLAENPAMHPKTKHIRLRYHKVRELVQSKDVAINWIPTEKMAADPLTKPMTAASLGHTLQLLGLA